MLKLARKSVLAHKRRLIGTGLSVIIGIAFLAGTFVFTDTIKRTFDNLFADEPTGNLDSRAGAEILQFMRDAVGQMGQTIVMVTHDPVAASYSDHALFLADGRIVDELLDPTPESVLDRMKSFGR